MAPSTQSNALSIIDEVKANQEVLRSRLADAISEPFAGIPEDALPSVPLIDLGPSFSPEISDRQKVAAQIRDACMTSGFFQISNHGVTAGAITDILSQAEAFFHGLTPAQKDDLHIRHSKLFRGYEAGGDTYVNPDDNNEAAEVETKEGEDYPPEPTLQRQVTC